MEPVWEDPPVPDAPFFTRDQYDIYSLAPNIRELWAFLQSPVENTNIEQKCDAGTAEASCSAATKEAAEFKDNSCISKEESRRDRSDSDDQRADSAGEGAEQCVDAEESKEKLKPVKDEPVVAYPEPRLPYPCTSSLSKRMQDMYLDILMNKNTRATPEWLLTRVNNEVMQFMGYLQDVARTCADDYNFISHAAMQYSEEFFRDCLTHIKTIPQLYQIHEMTSLTGGTFNPELQLTFEKQLLIMGNVDITDHQIVPADTQLASDYQSVSSETPPAKKAKDMHATISSDSNAENLCARYKPHVCLTRGALVRLLDNHGPDFGEQWELPVLVKFNPGKGNSQKKTVYIDSPLLKTEMTVRERNHIYHEESLKQSIKKKGSVKVFRVMTELPMSKQRPSPESSQRNVVPFENSGLDFEVDLTDLETFGESTPIKTPKRQNEQQKVCDQNEKASSLPLNETKMSNEHLSSSQEEMDTSLTNMDSPRGVETNQPVLSETTVPKTEQKRRDCSQESDVDQTFTEDSDDEKLVIDDSLISAATKSKSKNTSSSSDLPESVPVNSVSSPQKVARQRRQTKKRAKVSGDQLSEILHMQTAMFSSANDTAKSSTASQEISSPTRCMGPSVHSHPVSLVKPCVTSYLERSQNLPTPQPSAPVHNITVTEHKKLLSEDLQAGAEDEQDYKAPEEGNLLYKLYSLQDVLLMVRSSIALTHTRKAGNGQNQYVPVHLLPKLEYQLCYGVECLTSSEACQLWTETLLHSSNVSYTAHINAHTSKVALLRKLPDDWKQNISCGFKPSKSLNILHHLLKKLTGLEEGRYLIAHKAGEPFVTLLKVANGKVSRSGYNLQQIHSSVPLPPASGLLPWIPVDPSVVLPFHQKHGRVPCTFPLNTYVKKKNTSSEPNNRGPGQSKNKSNEGGKTKKKKNRAAKRKQYINKLIQKSV